MKPQVEIFANSSAGDLQKDLNFFLLTKKFNSIIDIKFSSDSTNYSALVFYYTDTETAKS